MSRSRDHHPRDDSVCPDRTACARLYHDVQLTPGDCCECCGVVYEGQPDAVGEALGSATDAADALGVDMAEVWTMVAAGALIATRPDDRAPWNIYRSPKGVW